MLRRIALRIGLFLYDHKIISEKQFEIFFPILSDVLFFIVTCSIYLFIGYTLSLTGEMIIVILTYNTTLNVLNRDIQLHSRKRWSCGLISGIQMIIVLFISVIICKMFEYKYCFPITTMIISYVILKLTLSSKGILLVRWFERVVLFIR